MKRECRSEHVSVAIAKLFWALSIEQQQDMHQEQNTPSNNITISKQLMQNANMSSNNVNNDACSFPNAN